MIDMIDKQDTYKMIKDKLTMLSNEIIKSITIHKRRFKNKMTDTNGLPNAMGLLLKHMRDDLDTVNNMVVEIKPKSNNNPKFRIGDFRFYNALWIKYKKIKETYETNK